MSGGSYNYLFTKTIDELLDGNTDLARMRDRLAALDYAEDAAAETEDIILILRQTQLRVESRMRRLYGVWRAVEWWDSYDSDEDGLRRALANYRSEPT